MFQQQGFNSKFNVNSLIQNYLNTSSSSTTSSNDLKTSPSLSPIPHKSKQCKQQEPNKQILKNYFNNFPQQQQRSLVNNMDFNTFQQSSNHFNSFNPFLNMAAAAAAAVASTSSSSLNNSSNGNYQFL